MGLWGWICGDMEKIPLVGFMVRLGTGCGAPLHQGVLLQEEWGAFTYQGKKTWKTPWEVQCMKKPRGCCLALPPRPGR